MSGFLDTQTRTNQVESLYIADFNRAADGPGENYWNTTDTSQPIQIAQSFVIQPEAAALGIPTDHTDGTAVAAFVQEIYTNLFSRTADTAGLAYWQGQITSGAVSLGAATYIIANGATGNDAAVLGFKIAAANYFTTDTFATNLGTTTPLDPTFLTNAHNSVAPVVDLATQQASMNATFRETHFTGGSGPDQPGTASVVSHDTTTGFLDTQIKGNQVEALYIADFNRAGDGPGAAYWDNTDSHTAVQIAQSFVVQPEAAALNIPTDHTNLPAVTDFIGAIYVNLFSHSPDAAGLAYWQGQITSGAVSLGAATYIIANGATGNDATVLALKITAADDFTRETFAVNLGTTTPLSTDFLTHAHDAVAPVVDSATALASNQATFAYTHAGYNPIAPPAVQLVGRSHDSTTATHHG